MILTESLLLCAVATVLGSVLGVLAIESAVRLTSVGGLIQPEYAVSTFVRAIMIAMLVAIAGAAYPSYRG